MRLARTPVDATRTTMARAGAALFGAGGILAVISVLVPHWRGEQVVPATAVALCAFPAAVALHVLAERVPTWLIHVLLVVASVEIALGAHFVGKGAATATAATIYVWVALYAFYFFPWPIGLAHLAVMGSAYGVLLAVQHDHAGPAQWVIAMGTAGAVGAVVSVLVGRLRELAGTDLLTGLPNRRAWEQELEREVNRAARVRTPLSVVLIDLDAFKALNDEEGHPAGDRLLREIAGDWSAALRAGDLLCRHGGDEFGVVLPNCDRQGGLRTVERLRGATPRLDFSVGLATWDFNEPPSDLVERADIALYRAKHNGRSRTAVSEEAQN